MKFEMSHTNVGTSKTRFLIKFCNPTPRTGQLDTEISGRGKNFKSDCRIMDIVSQIDPSNVFFVFVARPLILKNINNITNNKSIVISYCIILSIEKFNMMTYDNNLESLNIIALKILFVWFSENIVSNILLYSVDIFKQFSKITKKQVWDYDDESLLKFGWLIIIYKLITVSYTLTYFKALSVRHLSG
ncbi:hypothetical protein AGLY_009368 [Aphis glycines]|uniref:Uncharacterized protein n=1 Tax=Aphis glycines TaxID=307491 RepID=A0A6G0TJH2_APHGL|nr:hypothetical protein AGLY_009368 [Aphis glycines]